MKITNYAANIYTLTQTNSSTTVPVRLASASVFFRKAWIYGNKAAQTANTGTVFLGNLSANASQPMAIATGVEKIIEAPPGAYMDFYEFYLDVATANDGVSILYVQ